MQRILAAGRNAVLDLFGSGKHGFGAGNANTGTPASTPGPEWFNAIQEAVARAIESDGIVLDGSKYDQLATVLSARIRRFVAGATLPAQNIGPIWHDDYNSLMTWQSFTNNGANYVGYASVLVGGLLIDTQPTARAGYIKSGTMNLSRTAYAALRNWAIHNGIAVAVGVWAAGTIAIADNADGTTFRVFDVRGEFLRAWSDGRSVDSGRSFGSAQKGSEIYFRNEAASGLSMSGQFNDDVFAALGANWDNGSLNSVGAITTPNGVVIGTRTNGVAVSVSAPTEYNTSRGLGMSGARPRNVALLACIKY